MACSPRIVVHTHTDTQNDYCNPRCACAPRVNNILTPTRTHTSDPHTRTSTHTHAHTYTHPATQSRDTNIPTHRWRNVELTCLPDDDEGEDDRSPPSCSEVPPSPPLSPAQLARSLARRSSLVWILYANFLGIVGG